MTPGKAFGLVLLALGGISLAAPATATVYTYDNTTSGTIAAAASDGACVTTGLARTFTVSESFTVSTIALGLNATHPTRGEIRAVLIAPNATQLVLFDNVNTETNDDYDILLSANAESPAANLNDGTADPTAEPYYHRMVTVAGMNFYSGNSVGTWTLRICDRSGAANGTFNRARLILTSTDTRAQVCTSTVTFEWGSNGNNADFTSATVGGVTLSEEETVDATADGVAPLFLTVTGAQGNDTGVYRMTFDAETADLELTRFYSRFQFSVPVRDLRWSTVDIDTNGGDGVGWEDLVRVFATDGAALAGNRIPYSVSSLSGPSWEAAGDVFESNSGNIPATGTDGNVLYDFDGAVRSISTEYWAGDSPADPNQQLIALGDPGFCAFDYGDAPDTYGTTLAASGARHVLADRSLYLGSNPPDGEGEGQSGIPATTDDTTQVGGVDDEDGVASFPNYAGGTSSYTVSVTAVNRSTTTAASLVGYIDWNRDGDFADANERSSTVSVPANTNTATAFDVTWPTPPSNAGGTAATYARFRIAYVAAEAESPTGLANSGEVEDYPISENTLPVTLSSFSAETSRGRLAVRFATETETSTVGYRVHAWNGKEWQPLAAKLLPTRALDSLVPQTYELDLADIGASELLLEDVDLAGVGTFHGPFRVGVHYGREPELAPIDWAGVRAELEDLAASQGRIELRTGSIPVRPGAGLADFLAAEEGIYRVSHEDLLAQGIDLTGFPVAKLALIQARGGREVPIWVQPSAADPASFGPGAYLEFRGVPTNSLYTRSRSYRLISATAVPQRVKARDGAPGAGLPATSYVATAGVEKDLVYSFAAPNGDPWFETPILAQGGPVVRELTVPVDALADSTGRLQVDLWGVTNWPGTTPDHHIELWLNGTRVAEDRFDGLTARSYDLALPAGLLIEGANELEVRVVGDTGFAFDLVHVDGYRILHPRRFEARAGALSFPSEGGAAEVDGLPSPDVVVYSRSGRFRLTGVAVETTPLGHRARFSVPALGAGASEAAALVDVVAVSALRRPGIRTPRSAPRDLFDPGSSAAADYLVISHPLFLEGLEPLLAARRAQGYGVKVVDVLDLYAAYTGGEVDPEAIRSYLVEAASRLGTKKVLLVGGDSYDYLDHLGTGSVSLIPTIYAQTDELIRFSPADSLLADVDRDGVQDLAIGRLPARTRDELARLIDKTLRYPSTAAGAVFAADRSGARRFSSMSDDLTSVLPKQWPVTRAYVDDLDVAGARSALLGGFSAGPALVHFVGHSGPTVWTFEGLFAASDAANLGNASAPSAVVQWGCWNTYHVSPQYDTLAHRLLLAGPQGAAAVVGSSTLAKESSDARLGPELLRLLMKPGMTLGDALLGAKKAVARNGGDVRDVLVGWTLLGDPALVVER